jgi:hypothetical protein
MIWKTAVEDYLRYYPGICLEGEKTKTTTKTKNLRIAGVPNEI